MSMKLGATVSALITSLLFLNSAMAANSISAKANAAPKNKIVSGWQLVLNDSNMKIIDRLYTELASHNEFYRQCATTLGVSEAQRVYLFNKFNDVFKIYYHSLDSSYIYYTQTRSPQNMVDDYTKLLYDRAQKSVDRMAGMVAETGCNTMDFKRLVISLDEKRKNEKNTPLIPPSLHASVPPAPLSLAAPMPNPPTLVTRLPVAPAAADAVPPAQSSGAPTEGVTAAAPQPAPTLPTAVTPVGVPQGTPIAPAPATETDMPKAKTLPPLEVPGKSSATPQAGAVTTTTTVTTTAAPAMPAPATTKP